MKTAFDLLRINQWVKNLLIFAPAFFGGVLLFDGYIQRLLAGFLCFCCISSAIYILNDLCDVKNDRQHPVKSKRPIASGAISTGLAAGLMAALAGAAFLGAWFIGKEVLGVILLYAAVNIGYSLGLKRIAILDVVLVSSGFIFRVLAGGLLVAVTISHWLYIMTFLLALFLAIAKRRDDLLLLETTGAEMRRAIRGYNMDFVNVAMGMMSAVIVVSYILYVTSPEITARLGKHLYISVAFVIVGLLRYLQITLVEKKSGSPTRVFLRDLFMQLTLAGWLAFFAFIIYIRNGIK